MVELAAKRILLVEDEDILASDLAEFTGADRLLRLRWPCPVPGALPLSEVGDAVIGR